MVLFVRSWKKSLGYVDRLTYVKIIDLGLGVSPASSLHSKVYLNCLAFFDYGQKMKVYVDQLFDLQVLTCWLPGHTSRRGRKI